MLAKKNVRNVRGVGYMTGLKYPQYMQVCRKIQETNPNARLVGYTKGEAVQKNVSGGYYTAEELLDICK